MAHKQDYSWCTRTIATEGRGQKPMPFVDCLLRGGNQQHKNEWSNLLLASLWHVQPPNGRIPSINITNTIDGMNQPYCWQLHMHVPPLLTDRCRAVRVTHGARVFYDFPYSSCLLLHVSRHGSPPHGIAPNLHVRFHNHWLATNSSFPYYASTVPFNFFL